MGLVGFFKQSNRPKGTQIRSWGPEGPKLLVSVYFGRDELLNIDETSKLGKGDSPLCETTDAKNTIFTSHWKSNGQ